MSSSVLDLPEDVWGQIASHLAAPDVLHLLSSHGRFHQGLGYSSTFWKMLQPTKNSSASVQELRQTYMMQAYMRHLPVVEWLPRLRRSHLSPREGHLACVLSSNDDDWIMCMTGGFTDDDTVYVLTSENALADEEDWRWYPVIPSGPRTFVYGASLTALDATRAVRVGGFRAGGYSAETNQVSILSITRRESPMAGSPILYTAHWEDKQVQNPRFCVPRAYHTATLIQGRYLLLLGGMTSRGCIVQEAILDTHTWTWLDPAPIVSAPASLSSTGSTKPSGRHGHSAILDERRNRIVLFGGGSGTDLLRSGADNSEVWELKLGDTWQTELEASFPWQWSKIHQDSNQEAPPQEENNDYASSVAQPARPLLSPAETLCLGRCHHGIKVSPDTALLVFGSGRPSTNGILGYDLQMDQFLRPRIRGPLPVPRFTFASAFLERQGMLLLHGGYTSQEGDAISHMTILDLAPMMPTTATNRISFPAVDPNYQSYGPVTDDDARRGRQPARVGRSFFRRFFEQLEQVDNNEEEVMDNLVPGLAGDMLGHLIASGQYGGRSLMLMNMMANGSALVRLEGMDDDDEEEEEEDDDGDSDYQDAEDESDDAMGGL